MSTRRRKLWPLWVGLLVIMGVGLALFLRAKAPPEAARLLPEADAILYVHLKPLRAATHFESQPVLRSPDLQGFIAATGIVPERDLDAVAVALHRMPDPWGPNGLVAYSEVMEGHFDGSRLTAYLALLAKSRETYAGHEIYAIPVEGRILRVAVIGYDTVAASNAPTAEQIHSVLDRARASGLGTPGSTLLAARFGRVPLLAQAWGVGRIGLPFGQGGRLTVMGLELPLPVDTEFVASLGPQVGFSGLIRLTVEELAPDELSAQHTAVTITEMLNLIRAMAGSQPPHDAADAAMRSILASAGVTQHGAEVVASAHATTDQVRALASAQPGQQAAF